jgi:glutathione S-transferase
MTALPLTALVTVAALFLYFFMGLRVGQARGKYDVAAPATSGHPIFERHFRVHMNTLEWLPMFLAGLWMFAAWHGDMLAAVIGVIWIIGRGLFMVAYVADPKKRTTGFLIQFVATFVLLIGAAAGAIMSLVSA